jgi:hypothetical protein
MINPALIQLRRAMVEQGERSLAEIMAPHNDGLSHIAEARAQYARALATCRAKLADAEAGTYDAAKVYA